MIRLLNDFNAYSPTCNMSQWLIIDLKKVKFRHLSSHLFFLINMSVTTSIETQDDANHFHICHKDYCNEAFKYTDWTVHSKIDGPDPRDHFANERNFLSWLRVGMTLSLIGKKIKVNIRLEFF